MDKFKAFLASLAGKGLTELGDHVTGWIKTFVKTPQDKFNLLKEAHQHELALRDKDFAEDEAKRLELEAVRMFQQTIFALELEDRKSARDLYKHDSALQKLYAIVFLIGYLFLAIALSAILIYKKQVAEGVFAFVTMIFTSLAGRIGTITDFLFGASFKQQNKEEAKK